MRFYTVAAAIDSQLARRDPKIRESWPWFCEWLERYDKAGSAEIKEHHALFSSDLPNDLVVAALAHCYPGRQFFIDDDVLCCTPDVPSNRRIPAAEVFLRYGSDAFYSAYERGVFFIDPVARQTGDPNYEAGRG
jgi:hypothetical protein